MLKNSLSEKVGRYTLVLLLLVMALVMFPFCEGYPLGRLMLTGWCLLINAFLVLSLVGERMHRIQLIILASTLFGCLFVYITGQFISKDVPGIGLCVLGLTILFLCYSIRIILSSIYRRKLFTADLISGAVLSYLLLGIAWGALNTLIETVFPGSFSFASDQDLQNKGSALVYHSFVTLTTLGYGEILPLTRITRTSAYLEAATGVMYCAILVAGLISNIGRKDTEQ
jgi:hypothetical protein